MGSSEGGGGDRKGGHVGCNNPVGPKGNGELQPQGRWNGVRGRGPAVSLRTMVGGISASKRIRGCQSVVTSSDSGKRLHQRKGKLTQLLLVDGC